MSNSTETRKKLSLAMTGKKMSKEFSSICSDNQSEEWIVIDPSGNFFKIKKLNNFCKNNNLIYSTATQSYRKNEITTTGKNAGWKFIKMNC
jgi:hypothetical protein